MDTEVRDMEVAERIEEATTKAFNGVLVEYHRELGLRLCRAIANWVPESGLEDVLNDIRYARGSIEALILEDSHHSRFKATNHKG